jgi:hypothetical protein
VRALAELDGRGFVGGEFSVAGLRASHNAAFWDPATTPISVESFVATSRVSVVELSWRLAPAAVISLRSVIVQRAVDADGPFAAVAARLTPAASASFVGSDDGTRSFTFPLAVTLSPLPRTLALQVEPNPAGSNAVLIRFSMRASGIHATLAVYDVAGRRIRRLHVESVASGDHVLTWNGLDERGNRVGRGVYLVRLQVGERTISTKLVLARD